MSLPHSTRRAGALVLALVFALVAGCSDHRAAATSDSSSSVAAGPNAGRGTFRITPDQRARVHTVSLRATAFRPTVDATGSVAFNGDRSTQVLSPVSGPATQILVNVGTLVTPGAALATVSSPDFAAAVAAYRKAEASYRQLKRVADQNQQLFKNDALARRDLEQSETEVAAATADRDAAIQQMRALGVAEAQIDAIRQNRPSEPLQATIRAPIAGTVVEKLITPGQLLAAGTTPCFTIADLSTMWVMANVFAADLNDVAVGQTATVATDQTPVPLVGKVDYVAALVDPGTKAVAVRLLVPNLNHVLRRDMFVRVSIQSTHEHHGILIPASALLRDEDNLPFVFVATPDGAFNRRRITLGTRVGDQYEVAAGLEPGAQVVAEGALFLQFAQSQ